MRVDVGIEVIAEQHNRLAPGISRWHENKHLLKHTPKSPAAASVTIVEGASAGVPVYRVVYAGGAAVDFVLARQLDIGFVIVSKWWTLPDSCNQPAHFRFPRPHEELPVTFAAVSTRSTGQGTPEASSNSQTVRSSKTSAETAVLVQMPSVVTLRHKGDRSLQIKKRSGHSRVLTQ